MRCDTVRAALLDFSNDESGPVRAWAIRRHLAACAGCMEELASLQQFKSTLRRADFVPTEKAPIPILTRRRPPRPAFAAAAAALLVGGLLLAPVLHQSRQTAQNPGAAIAAALGRVNTWHFSGWKLIDGRQVPWEVWGRRAPWLYCERVGDSITWSDGKQRLRVFPPNPVLNRPHGLIIKTSGDQVSGDLGFLEDPAYQTLVNSRQAGAEFGDGFTYLYQQTVTVARFRSQAPLGVSSGVNANKLYTISKRDWLPTGYQLHYDSRTFARDTEYLSVRYDADLPDAVLKPPFADGYGVVDFTPSAKRAGGFRVVAEPVGMDASGNVIIVAHGWLGEDRLTPGSTFSLNVEPYNGTATGERGGRAVKYLYALNSSLPPGSDIYMPFAPLEPSQVARALPDTFLLSLSASPQILVRASDQVFADGSTRPNTRAESLINQRFHWRMPLPRKSVSSLMTVVPPEIWSRFSFSGGILPRTLHPSATLDLQYGLAERRREYYFLGYDYQYTALKQVAPQLVQAGAMNPDGTVGIISADGSVSVNMKSARAVDAVTKRHPAIFKAAERQFRARAVFWQQRKLELLPTGGATHQERYINLLKRAEDIELLAICYDRAGDKAGRDRTLRRLIQECQALPQRGGLLRRQAEWSLRTGQFPGDVGYKGPA